METIPLVLTHAADALLILASLGAAVFCLILSRRLSRLSSIDNGLGGAIAVLSAQVDDMNRALSEMKAGTQTSAQKLEALNREAQQLAEELELMLSTSHDLAPTKEQAEAPDPRGQDTGGDADSDIPVFGSRRSGTATAAGEPQADDSATIPLFLKTRSRMAGVG